MNVIRLAVLLLLCSALAKAQDIPDAVDISFTESFPKAEHVVWDETEDGDFTAMFTQAGSDLSVLYAADGTWLSTTTYLEQSGIPDEVQKTFSTKFPGYDVYDIALVETADGSHYDAMLENEEDALRVQVDAHGKILGKQPITVDLD